MVGFLSRTESLTAVSSLPDLFFTLVEGTRSLEKERWGEGESRGWREISEEGLWKEKGRDCEERRETGNWWETPGKRDQSVKVR